MSLNGNYCKAYQVGRLHEFAGWVTGARAVKRATPEGDGPTAGRPFADDDVVYVQENYVVTDGIFVDGEAVFDDVTPEWVEFCRTALGFEPPAAEQAS